MPVAPACLSRVQRSFRLGTSVIFFIFGWRGRGLPITQERRALIPFHSQVRQRKIKSNVATRRANEIRIRSAISRFVRRRPSWVESTCLTLSFIVF